MSIMRSVRPLTAKRISKWAEAHAECDGALPAILFGGDRILCCPDGGVGVEENGYLVAVASISRTGEQNDGQPAIVGVMVDRSRRKCGLGRIVLTAAVKRMMELGMPTPYRYDAVTPGGLALAYAAPTFTRAMLDIRDFSASVFLLDESIP